MRHARSDLALTRQALPPEALAEGLCFHAQQAAEKAIKAVLLAHGVSFPFTHSIERLITLVLQAGLPWPPDLHEAPILTVYAVESRYPGPTPAASAQDLARAAALATGVVAWAERMLTNPSTATP